VPSRWPIQSSKTSITTAVSTTRLSDRIRASNQRCRFAVNIHKDFDASEVDMRPYVFLRNIMNGVIVYQHLSNMQKAQKSNHDDESENEEDNEEQPIEIETPNSSAPYTLKKLVSELGGRISTVTGGTISIPFFEKLIKMDALSDDDLETISNSLDSCFFVYPFNSEHTIEEEYDNVVEMLNGWYSENDEAPTLIAFLCRNTFSIVIWKAIYHKQSNTVSLYELVEDDEVSEPVEQSEVGDLYREESFESEVKVPEENEGGADDDDDEEEDNEELLPLFRTRKMWKRVVASTDGGYDYDVESDTGLIRYFDWDMNEVIRVVATVNPPPSHDSVDYDKTEETEEDEDWHRKDKNHEGLSAEDKAQSTPSQTPASSESSVAANEHSAEQVETRKTSDHDTEHKEASSENEQQPESKSEKADETSGVDLPEEEKSESNTVPVRPDTVHEDEAMVSEESPKQSSVHSIPPEDRNYSKDTLISTVVEEQFSEEEAEAVAKALPSEIRTLEDWRLLQIEAKDRLEEHNSLSLDVRKRLDLTCIQLSDN